jgi:cellobiose phosphorylase
MRINPSNREAISDVHRCEPYVYAQMISGSDAPVKGEAKNSWLTGTAAWNLVAISQWILGLRAEHDGLRIDPVIPADWTGFTATRRFRGATYHITVTKPAGITGSVSSLLVDGRRKEGNLAPLPTSPGQVIEIQANY